MLKQTENKTVKTFYDIHTHAFDLSHPGLSVFLQREELIDSVVDNVWTLSLRWLLPFASLMPKSNLYRDRQTLTDADRQILQRQNLAADYQYAFAGIKVYPQLGFDPFSDDTNERDKVKYLYQYGKKQWRDAIIGLTNKYDRVYTDISCKSVPYYKELADLLTANPRLQERVLYGSDFSINLLVTDANCYSENLDAFLHATLEPSHQINICERNPEKFLFG